MLFDRHWWMRIHPLRQRRLCQHCGIVRMQVPGRLLPGGWHLSRYDLGPAIPLKLIELNVMYIASVDVNECEWRPCTNGTCTNVPGSFKCSCAPGLQLNANTKTCTGKRQPKFKLNWIFNLIIFKNVQQTSTNALPTTADATIRAPTRSAPSSAPVVTAIHWIEGNPSAPIAHLLSSLPQSWIRSGSVGRLFDVTAL